MPLKRSLLSESATSCSKAKRHAIELHDAPVNAARKTQAGDGQGAPRKSAMKSVPREVQGTPRKSAMKSVPREMQGTPRQSAMKSVPREVQGTPRKSAMKSVPREVQGTPRKSAMKSVPREVQGTPRQSAMKSVPREVQGTPRKSAMKSVPREASARRDRPTGAGSAQKAAPANPFRAYYWPTGTAMKLPGRQEHLIKLWNFLKDGHKTMKGKTMYCYGKPGTGKTLTAEYAAKIFCTKYKVPFASINCIHASLASNAETLRRIYQNLYDSLPDKIKKNTARRPARNIFKSLAEVIQSLDAPMVLILDEVDALDAKQHGQNLLSQVWSLPSNGPLMIISIANTLDLWVRHKKNVTAEVTRQNFLPYNYEECLEILTVRAQEAGRDLSVFSPKTLNILIRVVNNQEGDFRRILDICDQLSHGATTVVPQDVYRICETTLKNNFVSDFTASIKRLTLERQLALYCFGHTAFIMKQTKKKAAGAKDASAETGADASVELTVHELMSRYESIKSKLLAQTKNPRLEQALPKRAMTISECSLVLGDLVNECLIEEIKFIGRRMKPRPGKEVYRLLFPVDKVQKVLQTELMEHVLLK